MAQVVEAGRDFSEEGLPRLASSINDLALREQIEQVMEKIAISSDSIAQAIAFAISQPAEVDVGEIIVRPTAQN